MSERFVFVAVAPCGHAQWVAADETVEESWLDDTLPGAMIDHLRAGCRIERVPVATFRLEYAGSMLCDCPKDWQSSPVHQCPSARSFFPIHAPSWMGTAPAANDKLRAIDVSNLRFYAALFRQHQWQTDVIHWTVFAATLKEIADRIESPVQSRENVDEGATGAQGVQDVGAHGVPS